MKKSLFFILLTLSALFFSCSKSNSGTTSTSTDYTGTYAGTQGGLSITMQVFKGDIPSQIKILYGAWSTPANMSDSKFTIVPTSFGPVNISGSGSFSGKNMIISYNETGYIISATLVKQ